MKLCFKLLSTTTHFVGDEVKNCTNIPYSKQLTNLKHFAQTYLINRCFYSFGIFAAKNIPQKLFINRKSVTLPRNCNLGCIQTKTQK